MKKNVIKYVAVAVLFFCVLLVGVRLLNRKTTYLEQTALTFTEENILTIASADETLEETMVIPYDVIKSVSMRVTNYQIDCNAPWVLQLTDQNGEVVMHQEFRFIDARDNAFYEIELDKPVAVHKGETYTFKLYSEKVTEDTPMGFYYGSLLTTAGADSKLCYNGEDISGALCFSVYGGEKDLFWICVYALVCLAILLTACRGIYVSEKGMDWKQDRYIQAVLCGMLVLCICLPFAATGGNSFTDENDNVRGGMIIANGGVLYRDYVTQHTPFAYYLCGLFALLGATAVSQMRIMYYLFLSLLWAGLYYRHSKRLSAISLYLLPIASILTPLAMTGSYAVMVVSESIQLQAFIVIILELYGLSVDRSLSVGRSAIVALAAWVALGSVFISIYTLFFFVLLFIGMEIGYWMKQNVRSIALIVKRYIPLAIFGVIPAICGILYFKVNHALNYAFRQMYVFNREIYTQYQDMGSSILEPFFSGLVSAVKEYQNSILILGNQAGFQVYHVLLLVLLTAFVIEMVRTVREKQIKCGFMILLVLSIASGASRGVGDWHGQAFWGMLAAVFVLFLAMRNTQSGDKIGVRIALVCYAALLLQPWITQIHSDVVTKQEAVSYFDPIILNELDEDEDLFIDAYCNDSIYLLAKGHMPINRVSYCLPWYMDWYEQWAIDDLKDKKPNVVVWNPDQNCWDRYHYAVKLNKYIQENYVQIGEGAPIWTRVE